MTDISTGSTATCRYCGHEIVYGPWFLDGRGPNPPVWSHTHSGVKSCSTRPVGWGADSWPFATPAAQDSDEATTVRDAARQAAGQQKPPVGYGDGKGRVYCLRCANAVAAEVPLTVDIVDHWELCPSCGRHVVDVANNQAAGQTPTTEQPDPTIADDPTPLRWGLNDVLYGDDDTITICLSGPAPDHRPYWLELDPERAAVLRNDLAGSEASTCHVKFLSGSHCTKLFGHRQPGSDDPHTPTTEQPETCRPVTVDGTTVLVRGNGDWTEQDEHFMTEIVQAAKRRYEAEHPAVEQPAEAQPAGAQTARARLAALIGYEPGEHDAEYEKRVDELIAASLHEAARRMEDAGYDDDAVNFLDLLAARQVAP